MTGDISLINDVLAWEQFSSLTEDQKNLLSQVMRIHDKLDKKHKIVSRNENCDRVYFVVDGCIKIFEEVEEEKEHINMILSKGQVFGECCVFGKSKYAYDASLLDPNSVLCSMPSAVLKDLMKCNFEFNLRIFKLIGEKIAKKDERLFTFAMNDARKRIIQFLKENVECNGRKIGLEMLIKHGLTQQDIANFTGTSRQTVTTILNDLKSKNMIHLRRKSILVRDMATLA